MLKIKGTNWIAELCWLIKNNCDVETANAKHHMSRANFVDMGWSNSHLKLMTSPRVFQTHLRLEFLPDNINNKAKVTLNLLTVIFFIIISLFLLFRLSMLHVIQKISSYRCISFLRQFQKINSMALWRSYSRTLLKAKLYMTRGGIM